MGGSSIRNLVVACLTVCLGCQANVGADAGVDVHPAMAVQLEVGADERGDALSVLHRALDAAFLDTRIAVLDASPPFVRFFDAQGNYVGSTAGRGQGPGELRRPLGLGRAGTGSFVVNEGDRVLVFDADGAPLRTTGEVERYIIGAAGACGDAVVRLVRPQAGFEQPGAFTIARHGVSAEDTLVVL